MHALIKIVHLWAIAIWFGTIVFFSFFTALPVIGAMRSLGESSPEWLPGLDSEKLGTRLAGEALAPIFARYFPLQVICGSLSLLTGLIWNRSRGFVQKIRIILIGVALGLAVLNLAYLGPKTSELRNQRYDADDTVSRRAEAEFGRWHTYSLLTDMTTLGLVAIALSTIVVLPMGRYSAGHSPEKTSIAGPVM